MADATQSQNTTPSSSTPTNTTSQNSQTSQSDTPPSQTGTTSSASSNQTSSTTNQSSANNTTGTPQTNNTTSSQTSTSSPTTNQTSSTPQTTTGSGSSTNTNSSDGGFIIDPSTKTLVLNSGTPFSYTLNNTLGKDSVVTGYMPPGVFLDVANSKLIGKSNLQTGTVLSIYNSTDSSQVTLPIKINAPLAISFSAYKPIADKDTTFYNKPVLPAYRNPGDSPALTVVGSGGTGNYTFSLKNSSGSVTIDSKTGELSGKLPTDIGRVELLVSLTDGISTIDVPVDYYISDNIPVEFPENQSTFWWLDLDDSQSKTSHLQTVLASIADLDKTSSLPTKYQEAYTQLLTPVKRFIIDSDTRAVPYVAKYTTALLSAWPNLSKNIQPLTTAKDYGIVLTTNNLLNNKGASSQLGADMTNVAKAVTKWQKQNNQALTTGF